MTYIISIIFLLCLYLFLIMPSCKEKIEIGELKKWHYAHRGFHDNHSDSVENSMLAFTCAKKHQYGIELDVQLTKDHQVIVFHDDDLERMCGIKKEVKDYTYDELLQLSLLQSNQKIPLFQDVLKEINGEVPLIIEIKMKTINELLCKKVDKQLRYYPGIYCIESFHPYVLYWYRKHNPMIVRGQLVCKLTNMSLITKMIGESLVLNFFTRPDFIAYDHEEKDNLSRIICKKLFPAMSVGWTIKNKEDFIHCQQSFNAIIFEGFTL